MPLLRSLRNFIVRVKAEGPGCIPGVVYARWMTLVHRRWLHQERSARWAEEARYQQWLPRHEQPCGADGPLQTARTLSFLIPTYNTRPDLLMALADSLLAQSCPRWEACLYDGASPSEETRAALQALAARDDRFRVQLGTENGGISGNTNAAYAMATGDVIALCDHDDLLAPDAVKCILEAAETGADFIYTDEDKVDESGTRFFEPHLKPDFSPDALRSGNYICHITAMTRTLAETLVRRDGCLLRSAFDGSQDHDLALRATELAGKIVHVPRILYHWRMLDTSYSHQRAEKCALAACAAVRDQLKRLNIPAKVAMEALRVRIRYAVPENACVTAIVVGRGKTPRLPGEVIRVDDAAQINDAARRATGEYLLLLRGGMKPLNWPRRNDAFVEEMLMHASRENVGCVGSAILDERRFYVHAGLAVDEDGLVFSHHTGQWLFGHPYMITDRLVRNVTAVSEELLMIRRDTFLGLGGMGEGGGAELGLKCLAAGLLNVYTPHAAMVLRGTKPCRMRLVGAANRERYYSPLFTRDGRMTIDMTRQEAET